MLLDGADAYTTHLARCGSCTGQDREHNRLCRVASPRLPLHVAKHTANFNDWTTMQVKSVSQPQVSPLD
jgi:hypothetical protein